MPRKPCAVEVGPTAAALPTLTLAVAEAAVRAIGPRAVVVLAGVSAAAEAVAITTAAAIAPAAASAAARMVDGFLGIMPDSWPKRRGL